MFTLHNSLSTRCRITFFLNVVLFCVAQTVAVQNVQCVTSCELYVCFIKEKREIVTIGVTFITYYEGCLFLK